MMPVKALVPLEEFSHDLSLAEANPTTPAMAWDTVEHPQVG